MTWKIVNVLAVVFCGVTFLACMLVAPHTPLGGEGEFNLWTNGVQNMYANQNRLAIFLSLNRITVAERVILWNVIFYCCNMYVLDFLYSMMSSGEF